MSQPLSYATYGDPAFSDRGAGMVGISAPCSCRRVGRVRLSLNPLVIAPLRLAFAHLPPEFVVEIVRCHGCKDDVEITVQMLNTAA